MLICPSCRSEYRPGFTTCADCQVALTEAPAEGLGPDPSAPPGDAEPLVTIATFDNPTKASILASKLEAEGIESEISDAETVAMDPLWAAAVGGVKVLVRQSDAERGRELARPSPGTLEDDPEESAVRCPACSSPRTIHESISSRAAFLSILFLGFPLLIRKKGWKCVACGHRWKDPSPSA